MIWLTGMTMTSVGFGDISPVTPLGWIVAAICVTWGVLIMAVMVGVMTQILSLNSKETQSLMIKRKLLKKNDLRKSAGDYLRYSLCRVWKNKRYKLSKPESL